MSVLNGQDVSAEVTNAAFVSRTTDSNTTGVVALENTSDVDSGAFVENIQQAHNETFEAVGMTGIDDATRNDYSSNNVVTNGDDRKVAVGKLDAKFDPSTGHKHTGAAGDAPQISAPDIAAMNQFFAAFQEFTVTGAAGIDDIVTTQMSGKTSGGNSGTAGVITSAPNNICHIVDASTGTFLEDTGGQRVYGRLTFSASVWTLTYYTNEAGVETSTSLTSTDIKVIYWEVFTQATRPTIPSNPMEFGTLDVTTDVVDASMTVAGKINIIAQTFAGLKKFDDGIAYVEYADASTTGTAATIPLGASKWVQLTNASLVSVNKIGTPAAGEIRIITNNTGAAISIIDDAGTTDSITTGSNGDMDLTNTATIIVAYDAITTRWRVIGGSGGNKFILQPVGGSPNGDGASYDPVTGFFNLEPANGSNPGIVSDDVQSFAGEKNLQDGSFLQKHVALVSDTSSASGAAATLTITQPLMYLTNAALVSVSAINQVSNSIPTVREAIFVLSNKTTVPVLINNEDTGVTANTRILTGTGGAITMKVDASIFLCYDTSSSRWRVVGGSGSGSGSGGKNFLPDGDAESTNTWTTYADAAGSAPVNGTGGSPNITAASISSSSPLEGFKSFIMAKDSAANRQGQGWSTPFLIDAAYQSKNLKVSFDYLVTAGTFVAGTDTTDSDLTAWVYDITNSRLIPLTNGRLFSNSGNVADKFEGNFQASPDSVSYRLILHLGTTSATALTLKMDEFSISPAVSPVYAVASTDMVQYTPIFTAAGTVTNIDVWSCRDGDILKVKGKFTTGTPAVAEFRLSLGYQGVEGTVFVDPDKNSSIRGVGVWHTGGTTAQTFVKPVLAEPSFGYLTFGAQVGARIDLLKGNGTDLFNASEDYSFYAEVPIQGWSTPVKSSNGFDSRDVAIEYDGSPPTGTLTAAFNTTTFPTKVKDTFNSYSGGVWTCPLTGKYDIESMITITGTLTAGNNNAIGISVNGAAPTRYFQQYAFTAEPAITLQIAWLDVDFTAGDTVEIQVYTDGTVSYAANSALNYLSIVKRNPAQMISAGNFVGCTYTNTASTAITTTPQKLSFANLIFDSHNAYNPATGEFTAPETGYYLISSFLLTQTSLSTSFAWWIQIEKSGPVLIQHSNAKAGTGAPNTTQAVGASGLVYLVAGDTAWIDSFVDGGAGVSLLSGLGSNSLSIHKVG